MKLEMIYNPSENEIEPVERGLHEFNRARLGDDILNNFHRLLVLARDESSAVTGGAYGLVIWQWLHLQTLWVAASHRHQGLGSQILSLLENEAIAKGAHGCHLRLSPGDDGFPGARFLPEKRLPGFWRAGRQAQRAHLVLHEKTFPAALIQAGLSLSFPKFQ